MCFRSNTFGSRLVYLIHLRERVVERKPRKPVFFPQRKRGALTTSSEYRSPVPAPPRPWSLDEKRHQSPHPPVPFASACTAPFHLHHRWILQGGGRRPEAGIRSWLRRTDKPPTASFVDYPHRARSWRKRGQDGPARRGWLSGVRVASGGVLRRKEVAIPGVECCVAEGGTGGPG